jgi:hypothetical protein
VVQEAERAGVRMLRNETQSVAGLDIIGVDDLWARRGDPARALRTRTSDAAIVLVHNPDAADQQKWPGYTGWMLAGHTHGGQCKAPFLPPPLLPVQNKDYVSGAIPVSGDPVRTLYISPRGGTPDQGQVQRAPGDRGVHAAAGVGGSAGHPCERIGRDRRPMGWRPHHATPYPAPAPFVESLVLQRRPARPPLRRLQRTGRGDLLDITARLGPPTSSSAGSLTPSSADS